VSTVLCQPPRSYPSQHSVLGTLQENEVFLFQVLTHGSFTRLLHMLSTALNCHCSKNYYIYCCLVTFLSSGALALLLSRLALSYHLDGTLCRYVGPFLCTMPFFPALFHPVSQPPKLLLPIPRLSRMPAGSFRFPNLCTSWTWPQLHPE
jgi:hypothetical protein